MNIDPMRARQIAFSDMTNFPVNESEDELMSRNMGGNMFYTLPGNAGRATLFGESGDNEQARKNLAERTKGEEKKMRDIIKGDMAIENRRANVGSLLSQLEDAQADYIQKANEGYSPTNLKGREDNIRELKNKIRKEGEFFAEYDALQNRINTYLAGEQKKKDTAALLESKKDYTKTPEGIILQGQVDIQKELAKNEGKLSGADKSEIETLQEVIKSSIDDTERTQAQQKISSILSKYREGKETASTIDPKSIIGIQTPKGKIINAGPDKNGQMWVKYDNGTQEPYSPGQSAPQNPTVRELISLLPQRPDVADIRKSIVKEFGSDKQDLSYEPVRNLYAMAARNGDRELTDFYAKVLKVIPKDQNVQSSKTAGQQYAEDVHSGKVKQPFTEESENAPEITNDDIQTVMKYYNVPEEQAIQILEGEQLKSARIKEGFKNIPGKLLDILKTLDKGYKKTLSGMKTGVDYLDKLNKK